MSQTHCSCVILQRQTQTYPHSHPSTQRAMTSPQGCPTLSSSVLRACISLSPKVRYRLRETPRTVIMPLFFFTKESHVQPDFPCKKSTWSWSPSAEWLKNHRYFQPLKIQYSYFILYPNIYPGIS